MGALAAAGLRLSASQTAPSASDGTWPSITVRIASCWLSAASISASAGPPAFVSPSAFSSHSSMAVALAASPGTPYSSEGGAGPAAGAGGPRRAK